MKKLLFIILFVLISFAGIVGYQYLVFYDGKLHVVFCDVGQGDGILIKTPSHKYILIDAGPDKSIIDCLSKNMAFWDKTIDLAIITHPHADHFSGYYYVIDRYSIVQVAEENLINTTDGYKLLQQKLKEKNIPQHTVAAGDNWWIGQVNIAIAGPTNQFLNLKDPDGIITNSKESGSLAVKVTYEDFSALLTGDAPLDEMEEIAQTAIPGLDILQIPHHGSSTGIDGSVLDKLTPALAVISVGKNTYGHPTKEILSLLEQRKIKILRTDEKGDIKFVTDGKTLQVTSQ